MIKNKIKVLRAERNWTQEELANELQVSRQEIIAIEGYRYNPSLKIAFKFSELFEKPIEEIFTWEKE
ncbi:MAG: helix-turn-helix transcriptional regulator [Streptococcaceae bacterium]|nr:helix-turn-helix transcriptional regulator [Streptococcaceae bacterium]